MKVNNQISCRFIYCTHFLLQQLYLKRMLALFNTDGSIHSEQVIPTCTISEVPAVTEVQEHSAYNSPSQLALSRNGALQIVLITSQVLFMEIANFQVQFQDQAVKTLVLKLLTLSTYLSFSLALALLCCKTGKIGFPHQIKL